MCGVVGVFENPQAYILGIAGLQAIQTRGTDSAGAAMVMPDGAIRVRKRRGLVYTVFPEPYSRPWESSSGIFHVRYGTEGGQSAKFAHPHKVGVVAHCFNGNTPDFGLIAKSMRALGIKTKTASDNEMMTAMLNFGFEQTGDVVGAIGFLMNRIPGAYSSVAIINGVGVAFRDPYGVRPLVLGKLQGGGFMVASETEALNHVRATDIGEVLPGEAILFGYNGRPFTRVQVVEPGVRATCSFEDVYTMFLTSKGRGVQVAEQRFLAGKQLWAEEDRSLGFTYDDSVIIGVPDSGLMGANGLAWASGIRTLDAIVRRHHIGVPIRSFILPDQDERVDAVFKKLAFVLPKLVQGRRVILVDDSLVRGTTMGILVKLVRSELRAVEVHVRIVSPMITKSCHHGVATADEDLLLAHRLGGDTEAMRAEIKADSLRFLSMEGFMDTRPRPHESCYACMGGKRPVPAVGEVALAAAVQIGRGNAD